MLDQLWDRTGLSTGAPASRPIDVRRVGITLDVESATGAHWRAEYPHVVFLTGNPFDDPEKADGLRVDVTSPEDARRPLSMNHPLKPEPRDLDLRVRGRLREVDSSGTLARFTDVSRQAAALRASEEERKALKREVRALRARVRALGGDA